MLLTCSSSSNHHSQDFSTNLANLVVDSTQISSQGRFHQVSDLLLDGNLPTKSDPDQIYSMDIHNLNCQTYCLDSGVSKGGGLMRYNSAPSSILVDYARFEGILNGASEMDFPPLFPIDNDSSSSSSAALITHHQLHNNNNNNNRRRPLPPTTMEDMNHSSVLSAILEHLPSPHMHTLHYGHLAASDSSDSPLPEGLIMADNSYLLPPQQQQKRNKLIRHSSSPAGLLNRLASEVRMKNEPNNTNTNSNTNNGPLSNLGYPDAIMEHASEGNISSHSQSASSRGVSHSYDDIFCPSSSSIIISPPSQSGIMRQSSLPVGIMSKLTLESICQDGDKMISSPGNSTDDANLGLLYSSFPMMNNGMQDEAARRRMDAHSDSLAGQMNHLGMAVELNMDSASSSSVLCKARAKRGCATHPRSIAERVRRTKISEKMKKLQDLIPNMDKMQQANTADMLDEAVEYIKTLQRLVEELTISQSKCDGSCKN